MEKEKCSSFGAFDDLVVDRLGNSYYVLRHGESQANVEHLIVSDPDHGKLAKYGLTDKGRQQARAAAIQLEELWKAKNICPTTTTILTSCFSRARETAEIIAHRLNVPVVVEPLLRERYFGDFNLTCDDNYAIVWNADKNDASMLTRHHVESAQDTLKRALQVIHQREQTTKGHTYILVSHGDVLQILRAFFAQVAIENHRSLPYLENAQFACLHQVASQR